MQTSSPGDQSEGRRGLPLARASGGRDRPPSPLRERRALGEIYRGRVESDGNGKIRLRAGALPEDVISALVNLGYHRPLAEKAVASAVKTLPDGGFERTLKQALRELSK